MLLLSEGFGSFGNTAALEGRGWTNDDDTQITIVLGNGPFGGNTVQMVDVDATPTQRTGIVRQMSAAGDPGGLIRVSFTYKNQGFAGNTPEIGGEALIMIRGAAEDTGLFGADAPSWSINMSSGGQIQIEDMTDNTANFRNAIATGSVAINDAAWHQVEVEFQVGESSDGSVKTWVDGSLDINVSGVTTAKVGYDLTMCNYVDVSPGRAVLSPSPPNTCWFGHILVWDDRPGGLTGELPTHEIRMTTLRPTIDDGPNDWVASAAGDHADLIDDSAADGDATYIESGVKYARDMHLYEPLGFTPPSGVVGLVMVGSARNPRDGTQDMRMVCIHGADIAAGDDFTINSDYKSYEQFFGESPAGVAWTETTIDSTKFGVEPRDGT